MTLTFDPPRTQVPAVQPQQTAEVLRVPPAAAERGYLRAFGFLAVLGASIMELGFVLTTLDNTDGRGDFFEYICMFQMFVLPVLLLGVLSVLLPLLLSPPETTNGPGLADVTAWLGMLLALAAVVFASGGAFTEMVRAFDQSYDIGMGDWMSASGVALAGFAALVLTIAALVMLHRTGRRPSTVGAVD